MNNDAANVPAPELFHHLREEGPAPLGSALAFLKPVCDAQSIPLGILQNCILLFLKGNPFLALLRRRDTNVPKILFLHEISICEFGGIDLCFHSTGLDEVVNDLGMLPLQSFVNPPDSRAVAMQN